MEKNQVKALTSLLTKVAGLVFFAFLAISLGVVFGTLFKNWVSEEPLTPVQSLNEEVNKPLAMEPVTNQEKDLDTQDNANPSAETNISYKVRVGPFQAREEALNVADVLQEQGYPVYVSKEIPSYVQVGAFGNPVNADRLKKELDDKGFNSFIKEE